MVWIILGGITLVLAGIIICLNLPDRSNKFGPLPPPPIKPPLVVNPAGGEAGVFTKLQDAVDRAQPSDRILVKGHILEYVQLREKKGLTIETVPDIATQWKPPVKGYPQGTTVRKLLDIDSCEDCTIKGFTMDGADIEVLVNIWGKCPGLTLTDMTLQNYKQCGILINNCEGSSDQPVRLQTLTFTSKQGPPEAAADISFKINPALNLKVNRFITIENCNFSKIHPWVINQKGTALQDVTMGAIKPEER